MKSEECDVQVAENVRLYQNRLLKSIINIWNTDLHPGNTVYTRYYASRLYLTLCDS